MQIAEDSDVTSQFGGDFTHFVSANLVVFRAAVGEVKPNYVGAGGMIFSRLLSRSVAGPVVVTILVLLSRLDMYYSVDW